jgi:hypothetical protein
MQQIKSFLKIKDLSSKRLEQFKKEESIDDTLKSNINNCPNEIINYLLYLRNQNREQFRTVYETSILEYFSQTEKNLNENDIILNSFDHINVCQYLKNIHDKIII